MKPIHDLRPFHKATTKGKAGSLLGLMIFSHVCEAYKQFINVRQAELVEEFDIDSSSVSTYVRRLIENGLLDRDKEVTGTLRVIPTPKGMDLYNQITNQEL